MNLLNSLTQEINTFMCTCTHLLKHDTIPHSTSSSRLIAIRSVNIYTHTHKYGTIPYLVSSNVGQATIKFVVIVIRFN